MAHISLNLLRKITDHLKKLILSYPNLWLTKLNIQFYYINIFLKTDINRLLEQINRKVLRNTHLPGPVRDLEAAYLDSPHFRDICIYLQQNRLPSHKRLAKRMEIQVNNYL